MEQSRKEAERNEVWERNEIRERSEVRERNEVQDRKGAERLKKAVSAEELVRLAKEAMQRAYVPYSHFMVGAALLCKDGSVYQGCNIENAAYSPTNCAERTAFFKAVYDGKREFAAIAVCGGLKGKLGGICPPCGVCRQVMREFCDDDFIIYMAGEDFYEEHRLKDVLPFSFSANELRESN